MISKLKALPNPYFPVTSKLPSHHFIGREQAINDMRLIIEDYKKTSNIKNIVITGEKSIGKSTLLHRYKQILQDNNFAVYDVELPRDPAIEIDEFEFFKDIVSELFEKYASPEGKFFDQEQSEIWFSLTSDRFEHHSTFLDRQLGFATQYANRKKGFSEKISYKQLQRDFEKILDELVSGDNEIIGFAILIDEFQELTRNTAILEIFRQLSENSTGLMIIGAGLPTFLENPIFAKFSRLAIPINLKSMERNEVLSLIFKPVEKDGMFSRFELEKCFDPKSVRQIVDRSGGNPLHLRILCAKMFDYFQRTASCTKIALNRTVMEAVMEYYSQISERSRRIRLSLESCSKDQLKAFRELYEYESFSVRAAILLRLAFGRIISETEEAMRSLVVAAFEDVWDLCLFEFNAADITVDRLRNLSINALAQVQYKFIGDAIDKLYALYFYEDLTNDVLPDNRALTFEDILAIKLGGQINLASLTKKVPEKGYGEVPLVNIDYPSEAEELSATRLANDLDRLIRMAKEKKEGPDAVKDMTDIAQKYNLEYPSHIASIFELEGFYVVAVDLTIKGKRRIIYSWFAVYGKGQSVVEFRDQIYEATPFGEYLEQYMMHVNWVYVYWLPKNALLAITYVDIRNEQEVLVKRVSQRDFEMAVQGARRVMTLDTRLRPDRIVMSVEANNNYGFCLINVQALAEAKRILEPLLDKFMISRVNYAYIFFLEKKYADARKLLNRIIRKGVGGDIGLRFIRLAIEHPSVPLGRRIVENTTILHIAAWNLALINAQEKRDTGIIHTYVKKVKPSGDEGLVHRRVLSWISYYLGDIGRALEIATEVSAGCSKESYLYDDVTNDLGIFGRTSEGNRVA